MKNILFVFFAFALAATASAQDIHFGLKGGLNLANFSTDLEDQMAVGFHGGLFLSVGTEKIGVRPELLYSTKGAETSINFTSPTSADLLEINNETTLSYIDVPILLEYKPIPFLQLHAGPQFSLLLNETNKASLTSGATSLNLSTFTNSIDYESLDVGLVVGAGVGIAFLDAGVRYTFGVAKVSEFQAIDNAGDLQDFELRNNVFQIYVGYRFK